MRRVATLLAAPVSDMAATGKDTASHFEDSVLPKVLKSVYFINSSSFR